MRVSNLISLDPSTAEAQQVYKKLDTDREDTLGVLFDWREM